MNLLTECEKRTDYKQLCNSRSRITTLYQYIVLALNPNKTPNVKSAIFFRNITLIYTRMASINLGGDHIKSKAIPGRSLRFPGG